MDAKDLLLDLYGRIPDAVHAAVDGLDDDALTTRLDEGANSIAWLVWHLARVQDDHVSEVAGQEQAWTTQGWARRFALPFPDGETGYGFTSEQVGQVRAPAELLTGYLDAVHLRTVDYLSTLREADLDRIVDVRWDPPVTLGVRLVSVADDDLEHAAQAAFVRGVLERR
ncbi:mycothiol transferase [Kineococcus aurantiacus]|uniref:Putative damage-inducible protein DinB n=1 Tax=Kineococcus aurantiacus TaxID=37633 RepID=A0A7Y9DHK0_9ACTN|nr:DinB family protein [Kineococcus aurantiacus]NYD21461.1 putative damage-inducible protein DinB [Kineococcus aurantiacus]